MVLNRIIGEYVSSLGHDKVVFNFNSNLNTPLSYQKSNGSRGLAIPDYQLVLENNSAQAPDSPFVPKWIGEVTFTVPPAQTRIQLQRVVDHQPTVDLAFLVTIQESPKWVLPKKKDTGAQNLRSQPLLSYRNFIPPMPADIFGPVIVEGFTWMSITQISFEVHLRRPDGSLILDVNGDKDFSAVAVRLFHMILFILTSTLQTIYPTIDTKQVDDLLTKASRRLKAMLIAEMEASQAAADCIDRVRQSTGSLSMSWDSVQLSLRSAVHSAAYQRYTEWCTSESGKRKHSSKGSSSRKKQRDASTKTSQS